MSNWSTELLDISKNIKQKQRDDKIGDLLNVGSSFPKSSPYYRRDESLRAGNLSFDYTDEEIKSLVKIQEDPNYLLSLTKAITPTLGFANIVLRPYQQQALSNYKNNRFNIIINSRQSGMSLILALEALHYAYQGDKSILITANKIDSAYNILAKVKMLYRNLPFYAKLGIRKIGTKQICFDNGSYIKTGTFNGSSGSTLGDTYDFTIVDDYGHLHSTGAKRLRQTYMPMTLVRKDSRIIILGIPNGINHFKEMVYDEKSIFKKQWIPYHLVPNRDSKWIDEAIHAVGGYASFLQEYDNTFMGTKEWTRINNLQKLTA